MALFEVKYMKGAVLSFANSKVEDGATLFLLYAVSNRPIERLKTSYWSGSAEWRVFGNSGSPLDSHFRIGHWRR